MRTLPPSSLTLTTPLLIANGRYTLQQLRSSDGATITYLATDHEAFDRSVVVQMLPNCFDPTLDPGEHEHRRNIIRTLANLKHSALPQVYDYFQDGSHAYIVTEHIEGQVLAEQLSHTNNDSQPIKGQPYPLNDVIRWGIDLCRLLDYLASRKPPFVYGAITPTRLILDSHSNDLRVAGLALPWYTSSTPADDVAALAATLYHLATDDDPRQHQGTLPRLKELDRFGQTLQAALDRPSRLPTAVLFQQQLAALQIDPNAAAFQAPDGTAITDPTILIAWCKQHWDDAVRWLYGNLPDQIEVWWQQPTLAHDLRSLVQQQQNQNLGLDAALARIDPQGYGATKPAIKIDQLALNYGTIHAGFYGTQRLTIRNVSNRYVELSLKAPPWITIRTTLALPPGDTKTLVIALDTRQIAAGTQLQDNIQIVIGDKLRNIGVYATISPLRTFLRRHPFYATLLLLATILIGIWSIGWIATRVGIANWASSFPAVNWGGAYPFSGGAYPRPASAYPPPVIGYRIFTGAPPRLYNVFAFMHEDNQLLHSSNAFNLTIWQLATGRGEATRIGLRAANEQEATYTAAISPDRTRIATFVPGRNTSRVLIWDIESGETQESTIAVNLYSIAFTPDGIPIGAGEVNGVFGIWRLDTNSQLMSLANFTGSVSQLQFSADGTRLLTIMATSQIHVWSFPDGALLRTWTTYTDIAALSPDGQTVMLGQNNGFLTFESVPNDRTVTFSTAVHAGSPVTAVAYSPDGTLFAAATNDGRVVVRAVDSSTSSLSIRERVGNIGIARLAFSSNGDQLAALLNNGDVWLWPLR